MLTPCVARAFRLCRLHVRPFHPPAAPFGVLMRRCWEWDVPPTATARLSSFCGQLRRSIRTSVRGLDGQTEDVPRSSRFTTYPGWALGPMTCLRPFLRGSPRSDSGKIAVTSIQVKGLTQPVGLDASSTQKPKCRRTAGAVAPDQHFGVGNQNTAHGRAEFYSTRWSLLTGTPILKPFGWSELSYDIAQADLTGACSRPVD